MGELPKGKKKEELMQTGLTALIADAREADPEQLQIILQLIETAASEIRKISRSRIR
jgi:transcriptional regulator of heat shock response